MDVKKTSKYQSKTSSNKTQKPSTTNDTTQNTSSLHASSSQVSKKAKKRKIKKAASASSSNLPTTTKKQKVSTTTISTTQPLYTFRYHASENMNMCPLINIINLFKFMQCQIAVQRLLPYITQENSQDYCKKKYPKDKPDNFLKCCLRLARDKSKYRFDLTHEDSSWKFYEVSQTNPICLQNNNGILDWVCIYKNHLFDSARNTTTTKATKKTIWPYINGGTGTSTSFQFDYYIIREKNLSSSSSSSSDDESSSKDSTSIKLSDKNDETSSQKKSPPNRKQIPPSSSTRKNQAKKKNNETSSTRTTQNKKSKSSSKKQSSREKAISGSNHDHEDIFKEFDFAQTHNEDPIIMINVINLFKHLEKHHFVTQLLPYLDEEKIKDYVHKSDKLSEKSSNVDKVLNILQKECNVTYKEQSNYRTDFWMIKNIPILYQSFISRKSGKTKVVCFHNSYLFDATEKKPQKLHSSSFWRFFDTHNDSSLKTYYEISFNSKESSKETDAM